MSPSQRALLPWVFYPKYLFFSLFSAPHLALFFVNTTYHNLTWKPNAVAQLEHQPHEGQNCWMSCVALSSMSTQCQIHWRNSINTSTAVNWMLTLSQVLTLRKGLQIKISHWIPLLQDRYYYHSTFLTEDETQLNRVEVIYPWFHKQEVAESGLKPGSLNSELQDSTTSVPTMNFRKSLSSFEPQFPHLWHGNHLLPHRVTEKSAKWDHVKRWEEGPGT